MIVLTFLSVVAIFTFMYHYERNGNPLAIGDTLERVMWALIFALGYGVLTLDDMNVGIFVYYAIAAFIAIAYIPHAFAQNMGTRPLPYNLANGAQPLSVLLWWPGYLLPRYTLLQWGSLTMAARILTDFLGMFYVGVLRGALVFIPPLWFGASMKGALLAAAITALWQPISYWIGYRVPFALWTNAARSSQWGEFFVPIGWAVALLASIKF